MCTEISCSGRPGFLRHAGVEQVLASVADQVKNFAVIYLVDISEVCLLALARRLLVLGVLYVEHCAAP